MAFGFGTVVAMFCIAALTMPVGIGGGILFTPLLTTAAKLTSKQASALSQILITGAATASILFNVRQQINNPNPEALRIQAHYIYLSLPALLSGTLAGVYLGNLLPNILQMLALFLICSYGSFSIYKKAVKSYHDETATLKQKTGNVELQDPKDLSLFASSSNYPDKVESATTTSSASVLGNTTAREMTNQSPPISSTDHTPIARQLSISGVEVPPVNIRLFLIFIAVFFFGTIFLTLVKGGKSMKSIIGVSPCGFWFFLIVIIQILLELGVAVYYCPREIRFILESWFIGVITTMTGASPGILQNPLMMSKGLSPVQSTPISVITTFLTASTSSLDYLMGGVVPFWMVFLSGITFAGSIAGMTGITFAIQKTGRPSVIIFLLAGMAAVAALTVLISGITGAFAAIKNGDSPLSFELTC